MSRYWAARRRRDDRADDSGLTLVELIVSMGIFTVLLSMFMAGVVIMTRDTTRAVGVSNAGDSTRKVFQRLDKEIRYASSINRPGVGATPGTYYVEYIQTAVDAGLKPKCTQWRYTASTHKLEVRTWRVTPAVATAWHLEATNVRNDLAVASSLPFQFSPADSISLRQQLRVYLTVGSGTKPGAELDSVFVARNSSASSPSNPDAVAPFGLSDTPVCPGPGRP